MLSTEVGLWICINHSTFLLSQASVESLTNRSTRHPTNNNLFSCKITSRVHESLGSLKLLLDILTPNEASLCSEETEVLLEPTLLNVKGQHETVSSWRVGTFFFVFSRVASSVFYT